MIPSKLLAMCKYSEWSKKSLVWFAALIIPVRIWVRLALEIVKIPEIEIIVAMVDFTVLYIFYVWFFGGGLWSVDWSDNE